MLHDLVYLPILGKPLIVYLGSLTLLSFLFTASIPLMNNRGIDRIPFRWHPRMARTSLVLAAIHGLLGITANL